MVNSQLISILRSSIDINPRGEVMAVRYADSQELLEHIYMAREGSRKAMEQIWERLGVAAKPKGTEEGLAYIALDKAVSLYNPEKCNHEGYLAVVGHFIAYYRQWCAKYNQEEALALEYPVRVTQYAMGLERAARKVEEDNCIGNYERDSGLMWRLPRAVSVETYL